MKVLFKIRYGLYVILWLAWVYALALITKPEYIFPSDFPLPSGVNPLADFFIFFKYALWDNQLSTLVFLLIFLAAGCVTFTASRLFNFIIKESKIQC